MPDAVEIIYFPDGRQAEYRVNDVLHAKADDVTRVHTVYDETGAQTGTQPYTAEENAAADEAAAQAAITATQAALTDVTALDARLTRLAAYKTDPDLAAVLAQQNNQALPTASLNRALKTLIRENQRQSATLALLVRLIDPALLADAGDTTDS